MLWAVIRTLGAAREGEVVSLDTMVHGVLGGSYAAAKALASTGIIRVREDVEQLSGTGDERITVDKRTIIPGRTRMRLREPMGVCLMQNRAGWDHYVPRALMSCSLRFKHCSRTQCCAPPWQIARRPARRRKQRPR